jgi:hypothetical protein
MSRITLIYVVCVIRNRINYGNSLRPHVFDFLLRLVLYKNSDVSAAGFAHFVR